MWSFGNEAPIAGEVGKNCFFDRSRSLRLIRPMHIAENLCPSATVVRFHDAALAKEYAVSPTTLVVVEVCLSHVRRTSALHYLTGCIACSLCDS